MTLSYNLIPGHAIHCLLQLILWRNISGFSHMHVHLCIHAPILILMSSSSSLLLVVGIHGTCVKFNTAGVLM